MGAIVARGIVGIVAFVLLDPDLVKHGNYVGRIVATTSTLGRSLSWWYPDLMIDPYRR